MLANTLTLVPSLYQVLRSMEESEFEFFLTGSRFFGGVHQGSDYDFFVLLDTKVEHYLRSLDFMEDDLAQYEGDPSFVKVLTLMLPDGVIQVQLIKQEAFARKQLVQLLLQKRYGARGLPGDKDAKRELWHLAYHVLENLGVS